MTKESSFKSVCNMYGDLFQSSAHPEALLLREKLDTIGRRLQNVKEDLKERRERYAKENFLMMALKTIFYFRLNQQLSKNTDLKDEIDELLFWMDETEALLASFVDPCDQSAVTDLAERCKVIYL